ncbi:hypothetical protein CEXT_92011 [Caerostris extrusa]|uniref:Apple domain-containing protein n=1 Tax=Caerostris extrusa TaxID=172846 RepID=A0AAV4UEG0_CAEEX|nr:hypothetical protein CEXT_92011 [Caerostris extrusa]
MEEAFTAGPSDEMSSSRAQHFCSSLSANTCIQECIVQARCTRLITNYDEPIGLSPFAHLRRNSHALLKRSTLTFFLQNKLTVSRIKSSALIPPLPRKSPKKPTILLTSHNSNSQNENGFLRKTFQRSLKLLLHGGGIHCRPPSDGMSSSGAQHFCSALSANTCIQECIVQARCTRLITNYDEPIGLS